MGELLGIAVGDDVLALARGVPEWSDAESVVSVLQGGITNRNFRVDVAGRSYVIRLPGESTELLGIDRRGEVEAAVRAATLGVGPPVFGVLPGIGTVITEFVAGTAADAASLLAGDRLERLVGAISRFHHSGPLAHRFPIFRVIERHAADAVAHGVALPSDHAELAACIGRIEAVFVAGASTPVPCHNDLLPANVLFDGERGWLIDYEYAGMNEAMFDLANLSVNAGLDDAADDRVLAAYTGEPATDPGRWRLGLMKAVSEMREGMWALVQQGISKLDGFDFAAYADERLTSCRARLAAARLDRDVRDA